MRRPATPFAWFPRRVRRCLALVGVGLVLWGIGGLEGLPPMMAAGWALSILALGIAAYRYIWG